MATQQPGYWYYYLHKESHDLIGKNPATVDSDPEYFHSPFVQRVWRVSLSERLEVWIMICDALHDGANVDRCRDLAQKWGLTKEDSLNFLARHKPTVEQRKGLDIFIRHVLETPPDEYWKWVMSQDAKSQPLQDPKADTPAQPLVPAVAVTAPTPKAQPAAAPAIHEPGPMEKLALRTTPPPLRLVPTQPPAQIKPAQKPAAFTAAVQVSREIPPVDKYDIVVVEARAYRIIKPEDAEMAQALVRGYRAMKAEVNAFMKPIEDAIKDSADKAKAQKARYIRPLTEAEAIIQGIYTDWLVAQRKAAAEAEQKARVEATKKAEDERTALAAKAEAAGSNIVARTILATPIEPPKKIIVHDAPTVPTGATLRVTWKWRLLNFDDVPEIFKVKVLDERAIDAHVRAKKAPDCIPGIDAYSVPSTAFDKD